MVSESIKWNDVQKAGYNVDTDQRKSLKFLRLNQIDKYNKEMGGVDIADQLQRVYRID